MQVLHLDLRQLNDERAELRYFFDNPNDYEERSLALREIQDLLQIAERDYYTILPENFTVTGQKLYNWLDGSDRWLARALEKYSRDGIVLAIVVAGKLAHLPWEVLHNGKGFLVERLPAIVPVRWVSATTKRLSIQTNPEDRALQVLFMAASPLGVEPVLDFEAEEGRILEATERQPLALVVEESGCLSELRYLVEDYGRNYFDVLHLTGHATVTDQGSRFYTETETGAPYLTSANDIATELEFELPKLIFLSGCRTGQASKWGAVPSMAEELLNSGAKAVLGWGQKILDSEAAAAAATLYQALSAGKKLTEAVGLTYQALIKNQAQDWHLLRLYVAETLPGALVTPLRTRRRKPAPPPSVAKRFLDPTGKVKVPTRQSFVGRRRQLQNCLRTLTQSQEEVGVLIHGMGGLGKSSLAARLCDRLPNFEPVIWVGAIDEPRLVKGLAEKLDNKELRQALQDLDEELKFRLRQMFRQLEEETTKPFLLVLDDFEVNLETRNGSYVPRPEAASVLEALIWAIRDIYAPHRLILTCRYDFEFTQLQYFYKQPLDALRGADLWKKCSRLAAFSPQSQIDQALQLQAYRLADGNPRLLEWLDKLLQNSAGRKAITSASTPLLSIESVSKILTQLEEKRIDLRAKVLAQALIDQMDQPMQEMLSRGLVFEVPVPRSALQKICTSISNFDACIDHAIGLGLLEVSTNGFLRVPRILPLQVPKNTEALCSQATKILYKIWRIKEREILREEQWIEVHRLALLGQEEEIAAEISFVLSTIWNQQGQFRKAVDICCDTLKIVKDPSEQKIKNLIALGNAYRNIAQYQQAITCYEQALSIAEVYQNLQYIEALMGNLGTCYADIGQTGQAIEYTQKALETASKDGDQDLESKWLNNLGSYYVELGKIKQAIECNQKAKDIAMKRDDLKTQGACLGNLCYLYATMGKSLRAIEYGKQALLIQEKIQDWVAKGSTLHSLAQAYIDEGKYTEAIEYAKMGVQIGQQIGSPKIQSDNYSALAYAYIYNNPNDLSEAGNAAKAAQQYDVPDNNHYAALLLGLISLRQEEREIAHTQFTLAKTQACALLDCVQQNYRALNTKWLAFCGLALCGEKDCVSAAMESYQALRENTEDEGLLKRSCNILDALLLAHSKGILAEVRKEVMKSEIESQSDSTSILS